MYHKNLVPFIALSLLPFTSSFYKPCLQVSRTYGKLSSSALFSTGVNVLVPIATGSEEIETTCIVDTLVRGGASVTLASVSPTLQVTCSRGIKLVADCMISECANKEWDMIVCPGGMPGAEHLRDSIELDQLLREQYTQKKLIGAICASPAIVLGTKGMLKNKLATCYPAPKFQEKLENLSDDDVVIDGNIITSKGPGTSLAFSIKLVEILFGSGTADKVSKEMIVS